MSAEVSQDRAATSGWGWPLNARKPHFFEKGEVVSLCGRWMYVGERGGPYVTDGCAVCSRKLGAR